MRQFIFGIAMLLTSSMSVAALIDFEDTPTTSWYVNGVQSNGFNFMKAGGYMGVNNYSSWLPSGAYNGTRDLEFGYGSLLMSAIDFGLFSVDSLQAGLSWYNYDDQMEMNVTGYHADNSTVSASLDLTHDYNLFDLVGFNDVYLISFSGAAVNSGYSAIDNINVVDSVSVPEPSFYALFGLGLVGMLISRRRRQN